VDLTEADVQEAVRSSLETGGWGSTQAMEITRELIRLAEAFPIGAVVERRLDDIETRAA